VTVDNRRGDHCEQSPVKKQEERTAKEQQEKKTLDLIPDHNTETTFTERLFIPLEERGVVKRLLTALHKNKRRSGHSESRRGKQKGYRANETLPTPPSVKRLNGPHPVSNALLALLTLGHPQPYMTVLAIRMPLVHCEAHVCIFEYPIPRKTPVTRCRGGRGKERITTFSAKEVLLVVSSSAQLGIVECDEPLIYDGCVAVVTSRSIKLAGRNSGQLRRSNERRGKDRPHDSPDGKSSCHPSHTNLNSPTVHYTRST